MALLGLFVVGCDPAPEQPDAPPDVVLVLVDGLRDGAGPLGTAAAAFREGLGLEGLHRYTAAYTQSVEPYSALGALFTGRYPSAIPLCGRPSFAAGGVAEPWCLTLPDSVATLPQVLGLYGYETAFFSTATPESTSVLRGFQTVVAPEDGATAAAYEELRTTASAWWHAHGDAPRFVVVQAPLDTASLAPLYAASDDGAFFLAWGRERTDPLPSTDPDRYRAPYGGSPDAWAAVDAAYSELAAEAGARIRELADGLAPDPRRPRWVVTTSLRGITLGEFAGTEHPEQVVPGEATLLLERTLHVPLDLYDPDGNELIEERPVQLVDLAPTLFGLGSAVPPVGGAGTDLLGAAPTTPRAYTEFGDMLSLREGARLLTFRAERHGSSSLSPALTRALIDPTHASPRGTFHLFDVTADPLQKIDLAGSEPAAVAAFQATLVGIREGVGAPPPDALTPEREKQLQELRANGYW